MKPIDDPKTIEDELPEEIQFDYSKVKPNRFAEQPIMIALDPDVAAVFRDGETVNRVLRASIETMPRDDQQISAFLVHTCCRT